jgi:membrane-associated phospholipid phosphatase
MTKHKIATAVSTIGNPLILSALVATYANFKLFPFKQAFQSTSILILVAIVPVFWFINRKVNAGKYADHDVSARTKRPSLYLFGTMILTVMIAVLYLSHQPTTLIAGALAALGLTVASFGINFFVKTSLHTAFAFLIAMLAFQTDAITGTILLIFAVLVGWSRLALGRHSLQEICIGVALGLGFGSLYWGLISYFIS